MAGDGTAADTPSSGSAPASADSLEFEEWKPTARLYAIFLTLCIVSCSLSHQRPCGMFGLFDS